MSTFPISRGFKNLMHSFFTCTAPDDYMALNEVFGLPAGTGPGPVTGTFCRTLMVENDNIAEGLEDLTVQLNSLSPFISVTPPNVATVQIMDNDRKCDCTGM